MENPYPNKNPKIAEVLDKKQAPNPFEILAKLSSSQTFKPNKNQKSQEELIKARLGLLLKTSVPFNKLKAVEKKTLENPRISFASENKSQFMSGSPSFKFNQTEKIKFSKSNHIDLKNDLLSKVATLEQKPESTVKHLTPSPKVTANGNLKDSTNDGGGQKGFLISGVNYIRNRKKKLDISEEKKNDVSMIRQKMEHLEKKMEDFPFKNATELKDLLNDYFKFDEIRGNLQTKFKFFLMNFVDRFNQELKEKGDLLKEIKGLKEENESFAKKQKIDSISTALTSTNMQKKAIQSTPEIKNLLKENSQMKKVILDQQNNIYKLKEKEMKLIKFLEHLKKSGHINFDHPEASEEDEDELKGNFNLPKKLKEKAEEQREDAEADESVVNDSDESSFNYFGKPESIPSSFDQELKIFRNSSEKKTLTLNNSELLEKLKLNLSQVNRKNLIVSSSDHQQEIKNKGKNNLSQILKKKFSEQTHKKPINDNEEFLKNIDEMGTMWKKIFKKS